MFESVADAGIPAPQARGAWPIPDSVAPRDRPQNFAALDLGTNNCRLLIARPDGDGFAVVDSFSRIVRLGEGLGARGTLSEPAMDRTLDALHACADKLARRKVVLARSVATEACRQAANGADFVERVYRETGIALDIIGPGEEARLAVAGCYGLLEPDPGPAIIFDIGGGSTELVAIEVTASGPRTIAWESIPWGVVSLFEAEQHEDATPVQRLDTFERMRARVAESLGAFRPALPPSPDALRLLGSSGTVTTVASLHLGLQAYDRRAVDGLWIASGDFRAIGARLAVLSMAERASMPCIGKDRADLVVAGCAILEAIMDVWPSPLVGVADRGIREGILRDLMMRPPPERSR